MMNNIIFCEGKTDAIIISYYLENVCGWSFNKKLTKNISLPMRDWENEDVNAYTKADNELVIWGVGGQSNFEYAISKIIKANIGFGKSKGYSKLIVIRDHDQVENVINILEEMQNIFLSNNINIIINENNQWVQSEYINDYNEENEIRFLPIIIPFDKNGALETFILDAICEIGQEEKQIVDKSKEYISNFNLNKYLNTQRLRIKGEFAVTLGTMFPQKTFTLIDDMLKEINWVEYRTIQEGFKKLEEI